MAVKNRSSFPDPHLPSKRKRCAPMGPCFNILPPPSARDDLRRHYHLGAELGRGQFGVIRRCAHKGSGQPFACKSISKSQLASAQDVEDVRSEIEIMRHLSGHPNVVRLVDVYEDEACVHLVMELCEGGELFDRIVKRKSYPEGEAALILKSLMQVVKFCHEMGVIHRDLKPENILLATSSPSSPIKLADFGLALRFAPGEKFSGRAGSAYYIAPEVLNGCYSEEIDVWSAGVILYVLLSGVPPFWAETDDRIFDAVREGNIDFLSDPWREISDSAKDLISKMLCPDYKARLTPAQVLIHPWILHHTDVPWSSEQKSFGESGPCRTEADADAEAEAEAEMAILGHSMEEFSTSQEVLWLSDGLTFNRFSFATGACVLSGSGPSLQQVPSFLLQKGAAEAQEESFHPFMPDMPKHLPLVLSDVSSASCRSSLGSRCVSSASCKSSLYSRSVSSASRKSDASCASSSQPASECCSVESSFSSPSPYGSSLDRQAEIPRLHFRVRWKNLKQQNATEIPIQAC